MLDLANRSPAAMPLLTTTPRPTAQSRRAPITLRAGPALACLLLLVVGCASPLPPVSWLRLPAQMPSVAMPAPRLAAGSPGWQLMAPVPLPGHLDRDALLVPRGSAGLQPLGGARWAEPLRDAVPRLLRQDLAQALGAPLWTAPLPPGVRPARQLRLELLALDVADGGRSVLLQARWSLADPAGASPPQLGAASFSTPADGGDVGASAGADAGADALALAHRRALWQLAQRIAATP